MIMSVLNKQVQEAEKWTVEEEMEMEMLDEEDLEELDEFEEDLEDDLEEDNVQRFRGDVDHQIEQACDGRGRA